MDISLPVIIAPIGIVLGWILNQLSQGFISTRDDRKVRNQVLFNLLNIYHVLYSMKLDINVVQKLLFEELQSFDPKFIPDVNMTEAFKIIFQPIFSQFIKTRASMEIKGLDESYEKSVALLAPVDPIIAYRLSGQTSQVKYMSVWVNSLIKGIKPHIGDANQLGKDEPVLRGIIEDKIIDVYLKDMQELIENLSEQIGWQTKRRVSDLLSKQASGPVTDPELKILIQELFTRFRDQFGNNQIK